MGYPETFRIPVSDTQAYRQFGNSVVVPVAARIAESMVAALSRPANHRPDLVLEPDDWSIKRTAGVPAPGGNMR